MSDQVSKSSRSEEKGGIGTVGIVLIVVAAILLLPVLIGFVFGVAWLALKLVLGAVGAVIGALGAVFGIILGALGALVGIFASMSVILLLLLPGIIIGLLLARAIGRRKAE